MNILYFAWLRTQIGKASETIDLPQDVKTLEELLTHLRSQGDPYMSALADMTVIRIAVDQEYIQGDRSLEGVKEVAFFPPVTGG